MNIRIVCIGLAAWCCALSWAAPPPGDRKKLTNDRKAQQTKLAATKKQLQETEKTVNVKMRDITQIANQIKTRQRFIDTVEVQLRRVSDQVEIMQQTVDRTALELAAKKDDYARALRYAAAYPEAPGPLLFVFSSQSFSQMYRRSRYAREYANYQRTLAEDIVEKQNELMEQRNELLRMKAEKDRLLTEHMEQKALLQKQHDEEKRNVTSLQKKQKTLQKDVATQQKQLNDLNAKINQIIEYERKEQERREAARRKAAEARKKAEAKGGKSSSGTSRSSASGKKGTSAPPAEKWRTPQDEALSGNFERNKGRLPVPITGSYMLGSRYGAYNVPGVKGVKLDNKGTNYIGRPGAMARCIFDGRVMQVFHFGGMKNVIVRHGHYISMYCNLSSVRVAQGQNVKTRDILGTVDDDGTGNYVLHFQIRNETKTLNPESWVGR